MNTSSAGMAAGRGTAVVRSATGGRRRRNLLLALGFSCALFAGCQPGSATPTVTAGPAATPAPTPTVAPSATPTAPTAPVAQVAFNDMELDALADPMAQSRTFTFTSDGPGPVSVAIVKNKNPSDSTKLCLAVDGGAPTCNSGKTPSLAVPATTTHSTWVAQAISAGNVTTPIVDIALSWPTNNPAIKLEHGRLQGSSSPGVNEELNGFNFTFIPRAAGAVTVSAKWTTILTYIDVVLFDAMATPWVNLDELQYQGGGNGVSSISPPYTHPVVASKTYRLSLRDTQADNFRPDLTAEISFP
jgi:hypothetical protein